MAITPETAGEWLALAFRIAAFALGVWIAVQEERMGSRSVVALGFAAMCMGYPVAAVWNDLTKR